MLQHPHVIAQLSVSLISLLLLLPGLRYGFRILRFWDAESRSESQIALERSTYLVSTVLFFISLIQALSLVLFLITVNEYLPSVIKGAMCGVGSLEVNAYGYPLLFLKMFSVFIFAAFLMLHYLDNREPGFPLTPFKYRLVPVIALFALADLILMLLYFINIEPDIVATCCSVNFTASKAEPLSFLKKGAFTEIAFVLWGVSGLLQTIRYLGKLPARFELPNTILFTASGIYVLKFYFVKYIYGVPTHNCLFDIFFAHNEYSGYGMFGGWYLLLLCALFRFLTEVFSARFTSPLKPLLSLLSKLSLIGFLLSTLIPIIYRLSWDGTL